MIKMSLKNVLMEGKFDVLSKKYPSLNIEEIFASDPSPTNKYSEWMCKQLIKGFKKEDLFATVESFHRIGQNLTKKDINQYKDLKELEDMIKDRSFSKTQKRKVVKSEGTEKIYEDETSLVLRIDTKEACVFYGSNTRWCITMTDEQYYEDYVGSGVLFYFILSKIKREDKQNKVAVAISENIEYFDEEDKSLGISSLKIANIEDIINTILENSKTIPEHISLRLSSGEFTIEEYKNYVSTLDNKNNKLYIAQIKAAMNPNCPEELLEELISSKDKYIVKNLASRKNLSLKLIEKLSKHTDPYVQEELAKNKNTPLEILKKLYYKNYLQVDNSIAENPNIDEELFYSLYYKYKDTKVFSREAIIFSLVSNKSIPKKLLIDIFNNFINDFNTSSVSSKQKIIYKCLANPKIPLEYLEKYSDNVDYDDYISIMMNYSIIENPKTPIHILKKISSSKNSNASVSLMASNKIKKLSHNENKKILNFKKLNELFPYDSNSTGGYGKLDPGNELTKSADGFPYDIENNDDDEQEEMDYRLKSKISLSRQDYDKDFSSYDKKHYMGNATKINELKNYIKIMVEDELKMMSPISSMGPDYVINQFGQKMLDGTTEGWSHKYNFDGTKWDEPIFNLDDFLNKIDEI